MCGFLGEIAEPKCKVKEVDFEAAIGSLSHRGPDTQGFYSENGVQFGHRRLAIFDLSEEGRQPFSRWQKTIVYNGAVFNFSELKAKLHKRGYTFRTKTDTEVILAMYDCYGVDCVSHFIGQWSFAIYDKKAGKLFCSRDRFGIKPFYYWTHQKSFFFASEIKAFTNLPRWKPQINWPRAHEYLSFKMHDHTSQTFFQDVHTLLPGHNLELDLQTRTFQITKYYSIQSIETLDIGKKEALDTLKDLLNESISLRLRGDVPAAIALSGGLDSSIVALRTAQLSKIDRLSPTFSIVHDDPNISERPYLDSLYALGKFARHEITPTHEEFLNDLDNLIWHQEEPFNGMGVYAQYRLYEKASETGYKVILDGQGADEIYAGYDKFYLPYLKQTSFSDPKQFCKSIIHLLKRNPRKFLQYGKEYYAYQAKKSMGIQPKWIKHSIAMDERFLRNKEDTILAMSRNLLTGLGIRALLRYQDKNAMAHGVESRLPYLDHRLVEFGLALPDHLKIKDGVNKWILREANKECVPKSILQRKDKLGYATPEKMWYRQYKAFYENALHDLREQLDPFIDFNQLSNPIDQSQAWRLLVFGKWLKRFNIGGPQNT